MQPPRATPAARRWLPLLAALAAALTGAATAAAQRPPNIVWISAEDLGPRMGAYGDPVARTPSLDRLAREGVRFTRAFATAAICAPSRSAIITGVYQSTLGSMHMRTSESRAEELPGPYEAVPPHYVKAFTEYLRAAGYYTTNNVKTDYQFAVPRTAWDESSNRAHWRNRPDPAQPFFSVFNIEATHESQVWAGSPSHRGRSPTTDPASVVVPPYYPDTRAVREDLARHYDNVARMDARVGEILRQLEEDGLAESTVVFFWTDHGDGLPRAKRWLYDSGLRVPLVVRWPGRLPGGTVDPELVSLVDLAPTVLSLAGVPVPRHLQGRPLLGAARGPEPDYLFASRDRVDLSYDMVRSVRDRRFKYIRNFHPQLPYVLFVPYANQNATMAELHRLHAAGGLNATQSLWMRAARPPEELYDTDTDPHEVRNLASDPAHAGRLARMRAELDAWMERTRDLGREAEAEMIQRMWPGGVQPRTGRPYIVGRTATELARSDTLTLAAPAEVDIYVPTQGASIAYTTEAGESPRWRLYSGPLRVTEDVTVRARAIRYGYAESEETRIVVRVRPSPPGATR